jgi:hypothetical protein
VNNIPVATNQHHVTNLLGSRTALPKPLNVFRWYGR